MSADTARAERFKALHGPFSFAPAAVPYAELNDMLRR